MSEKTQFGNSEPGESVAQIAEREAKKEKRIKELFELRKKLGRKIEEDWGGIKAFDFPYSGANHLGCSTSTNSPFTSRQVEMALVLRAENPLIKVIVDDPIVNSGNFNPLPLAVNKVLQGLKFLDLGCGEEPSFARVVRNLGAQVYTLDVIPADRFDRYDGVDSRPWVTEKIGEEGIRKQEDKFHIQIDLRDKDAFEKIMERTGGNFDMVTSSHLETGSPRTMAGGEFETIRPPWGIYPEAKESLKLLKPGGLYYPAGILEMGATDIKD